jgi:flagellar secretion chaperone FliS
MQLSQFVKSYKSTAVQTATPGQLVLMLFDGALRFLATATHGFTLENIAQRNELIHNNLIKTQNIVRELQCSLNMTEGGEFAQRMYALYDYVLDQMRLSNRLKDASPLVIVENVLRELREAWAQMLQQAQTQAA